VKKKVKPTLPEGEEIKIKSFLDMIAPSVVKFFPDHYICGNTYRCVWALREYPTSTDEQAILKHLGEKNGVTLHNPFPERLAGTQLCILLWHFCTAGHGTAAPEA